GAHGGRRSVKGGERGVLVDGGRGQASLGEAQAGGVHGGVAGDEAAHTRTTGRVTLGDRVDHDGVLAKTRDGQDGRRTRERLVSCEGEVRVDKLAVDLVHDEVDASVNTDLTQRGELGGAEDHAGGVARRRDDEGAGPRSDGCAHALGR